MYRDDRAAVGILVLGGEFRTIPPHLSFGPVVACVRAAAKGAGRAGEGRSPKRDAVPPVSLGLSLLVSLSVLLPTGALGWKQKTAEMTPRQIVDPFFQHSPWGRALSGTTGKGRVSLPCSSACGPQWCVSAASDWSSEGPPLSLQA